METLSTTNPIPPTGGTNTSVPLGITATTELKPIQLNSPIFESDFFSVPKKILIDTFEIKNTQNLYEEIYSWSVRDTKLKQYFSRYDDPKVTPWNLIPAYYSKQVRMEYQLLFYPIKVTNCKVKVDAIVDYLDQLPAADGAFDFTNQNNQFELDDPDGIITYPIPQYYITNNVPTDMNYFDGAFRFPAFLPQTKVRFTIANRYHNNNLQPDSFNVKVFLLAIPVNPQNLVGKKICSIDGIDTQLSPYYYCKTD